MKTVPLVQISLLWLLHLLPTHSRDMPTPPPARPLPPQEYHLGIVREQEKVTRWQTINLSVVSRGPIHTYCCEDMPIKEVTSLMDSRHLSTTGPHNSKSNGKDINPKV